MGIAEANDHCANQLHWDECRTISHKSQGTEFNYPLSTFLHKGQPLITFSSRTVSATKCMLREHKKSFSSSIGNVNDHTYTEINERRRFHCWWWNAFTYAACGTNDSKWQPSENVSHYNSASVHTTSIVRPVRDHVFVFFWETIEVEAGMTNPRPALSQFLIVAGT